MEISRIDAALLRVSPETTRADPSLGLSLGQQLAARVIATSDGRAQLAIAGRMLEARTALPLAAGQQIQVEVASLGAEITLRLLGGATGVSERHLALAALSAVAQPSPAAPLDLGALWRAVEAASAGQVDASVHTRLSKLLGGLPAGAAAAELAGLVRDLLENGGLLFERRVRAWLDSQPQTAAPASTPSLPASLTSDLKVLLGVLTRALTASPESGTPSRSAAAGAPSRGTLEALRAHAERWLADPATGAGTEKAAHGLQALRDGVLARQVEAAYHWVRDGTIALEVPLVFDGHPLRAQFRCRREAENSCGEQPGGRGQGFYLDFALDPPDIGPIRAQAHLAMPRLSIRFLAARREAASRIEAALPSLHDALQRAGVIAASTSVEVDPRGALPEPLPPPAPPPGGSVLDVRA